MEASRNSGLTTLLSYLAQMKGLEHHAIHAIASRESQGFTAETIAPLLGAVEICQKSGQKTGPKTESTASGGGETRTR